MKKHLLIFLLMFSSPAFASGINANTNSAPCTNNTLETYSGNTNLQADWAPNTINLRWYNGNTLLDVQSTANTCVYDGTLTIPSTAPSRIGYTFDGWQVRPEMDFRTIPTNVNGTECWTIGQKDGADYCVYREATATVNNLHMVPCDSDIEFTKLRRYEWEVKFEHGNIYGMAMCSTTNGGNIGTPGVPSTTKGGYCWCKMTGYRPANQNTIYVSTTLTSWVHDQGRGNTDANIYSCEYDCAAGCAFFSRSSSSFRSALLTPVQ